MRKIYLLCLILMLFLSANCTGGLFGLPTESGLVITPEKIVISFEGSDQLSLTFLPTQKTVTLKGQTRKYRSYWHDVERFKFDGDNEEGVLLLVFKSGQTDKIGIVTRSTYSQLKKALGKEIVFD